MMRNDEQYSLTQLCFKLDLSTGWVKKIEDYLALKGWGSGQRGRKSYYSRGEFEFFKKVKVLRMLGLGLDEVKDIYEMEYEIQNYLYKNFSPSPDEKSHILRDKTAVHPKFSFDVYLTTNIIDKTLSPNFISETYEKFKEKGRVEAEKLERMYSEYRERMRKVLKAGIEGRTAMDESIAILEKIAAPVGE